MAPVTYAVEHPLAPPTVSGTQLTVDLALQNPTIVTRRIMDLTLQKFIADRVFASAGGVTGGAVLYEQATLNDLYLDRDVAGIDPGGEYPIVTAARVAPLVAQVEKWGGKFFITDEARDRNNVSLFNNQVTKLANTIVRKINQRAIQELEASIAISGQTMVGSNWGTALTTSLTTSTPASMPFANIIDAQEAADVQELGVVYDTLLVNPAQGAVLRKLTKMPLNLGITDIGIDEVFVSNRVPAATAYLVARNQVGEMRMEQPLATETWREQGTDRNWLKSGVRPVMYVTDPYSVVKLTGLAG